MRVDASAGVCLVMNLLFYLPRPGGRRNEILGALTPFFSGGSLEVFPDLKSFAARLRRPKDPLSVSLIWNPTIADLREIAGMRDFLAGVRTLLVLPDQEKETIALAHMIHPSYITYAEEGLPEIICVLGRLAEFYERGVANRS
ncbi:MAG: hypothetical protein PHX45_08735 [Acidobacteriota bacterium]|nr:hypothetical protein [Acidobacteriota bacterium]